MSELLKQIEEEVQNGQVGEYDFVSAKLAELKETYGQEVPQCDDKKGYDRSKSIAGEMRKLRTSLETKRKEIKAPALAFGKMIDSEAKRITAEIQEIEQPHADAYKAVDLAKKQRKEEIEQRILDIKNIPNNCFQLPSVDIEQAIEDLACVSIDKETFGHKLEEADNLIQGILGQLSSLHAKAIEDEAEKIRIEAERAELEKLRREQQEREEAARQEQLRIEQERRDNELKEQARLDAIREQEEKAAAEIEAAKQREIEAKQQAGRAELQRVEQQRIAEQQAKEAAERAEIEKQQAIEAEKERQRQEQARIKAETEAREADKQCRAGINNAALQSFVAGGLTEKQAKLAVTLIASKQIDNVVINY